MGKRNGSKTNSSNNNILPESPLKRFVVYICIFILTIAPMIMIVVCIGLAIYTGITGGKGVSRTSPAGKRESNVEEFGQYLYLEKTDGSSYKIVSENDHYDKKMEWAERYHCYYDHKDLSYTWYDSSSKEWMYWYKDISGNYGTHGWVKNNSNGWEIENSDGKWVKIPENYDRTKLWDIKTDN
ncbi:MAG: hypothetical protein IKS48_09815 [Eubacterium sp.]|nr:hypothetical protein [Eubacterium sp.]